MLLRGVILTCFVLLLIARSVAAEEDPVFAKAGDYVMRKSDFDRVVSYYPADKQKFLQDDPKQKVILIKNLMQAKIMSDIARRKGFDQRTDVKEQLEYLVNDYLYKEYLINIAMNDVIVTEDDQKQYYSLYKNKHSLPEQVKLGLILFKTPAYMSEEEKKKKKETAELILEKLKKGEDFTELAKKYSEQPRSAKKGGDLGYIRRDQMPKALAEVAFALKPGSLSELVETKDSYFIIKVEDFREAGTKPFEEVKDEIRKQLQNEFAKTKAAEILDRATKDAGLEVYADKITADPEKIE